MRPRKNFVFIFVSMICLAVGFICGKNILRWNAEYRLRSDKSVALTYPVLSDGDFPSIAGTWILTNQSLKRLQVLMQQIDSRKSPRQNEACEVFPTALQIVLSGTKLQYAPGSDPKFTGVRDTWPMRRSHDLAQEHLDLDAELFGWWITSDMSHDNASGIEGGTATDAKSWLVIHYQWMPDIWKKNYYAFAMKNGCLIFRSKFQFSGEPESAVLEWRKVSETSKFARH